jgi:hypothetical protein
MATKGLSSDGGDGSSPISPVFLSRGGQQDNDHRATARAGHPLPQALGPRLQGPQGPQLLRSPEINPQSLRNSLRQPGGLAWAPGDS